MIAAPLSADGDSLRNGGAVFVDREGFPVVAHYGSVAAEIAVCMKAAGLVDRSGLDLLVVEGPALLVGHVLAAAAPGSVPEPGTADCVGGTWCARTAPEHAIVAGMPSAVARWRQITRRAIASAALPVRTNSPGAASALSLVGPKAPILLERAGLAGNLVVHGVATGAAGGVPVTLIREAGDHYLLLLEQGGFESVWACLIEAGRELGVAPVGNEALERLEAAARPHMTLH